ncbi:MAG TPA: peptide-methionine (R)-S-oxide reductase MsrB [Saprospiraceae bacterium]|nr:peptide-methionine (R)-S-oxide reductase MsrB [Saprospiraceae bacterium]
MKIINSKTKIIYSITLLLMMTLMSCQAQADREEDKELDKEKILSELHLNNISYIEKSEEEWSKELTDKEYYILREKGTEPRYSSALLKEQSEGLFVCAACQLPLFESKTKYKSGTGWPSFYDIVGNHVQEKVDRSNGMNRTEVVCRRCQGHLGHVFADGPKPTGLRYCINGIALDFIETNE